MPLLIPRLAAARRAGLFLLCVIAAVAARAAEPPPGVVIDHIAPPKGTYIGSPSIAVLPDGSYVASHDIFGPKSTKDITVLFASRDHGQSWSRLTEIKGQWWSNLFVHRGALYLMGPNKEYGQLVIRRSTDGGNTWTTPADAKTGLLRPDGKFHTAPEPVVVHNGRLWRAMEDAMAPGGWGHHFRALMCYAPGDADLLDAAHWTYSNPIARDPAWLSGKFNGWLEGNAVVTPEGKIVDVLRVDNKPEGETAAIVRVSDDGRTATFDPDHDFIHFPGGTKKFTIRFDPESQKYWSLSNYIPKKHAGPNPGMIRNTLALISSPDLRTWTVNTIVLYHPDVPTHGYQYPDWLFDGPDLIAVVRTAHPDETGNPHNQHDANYMTFHRLKNFRTLSMKDAVARPDEAS